MIERIDEYGRELADGLPGRWRVLASHQPGGVAGSWVLLSGPAGVMLRVSGWAKGRHGRLHYQVTPVAPPGWAGLHVNIVASKRPDVAANTIDRRLLRGGHRLLARQRNAADRQRYAAAKARTTS